MTEMTIEYDGRNKTVKQILEEFKQALTEAKEMAENITAGNDNYETMDEFLKRL